MTRIIARIRGGLGNQLFCYAAARRLSLVNNAELVLDDTTGFVRDERFRRKYALNHFNVAGRIATRRERMEPFERYRRGASKVLNRTLPFSFRSYIEQEHADFDARLLKLQLRRTIHLDGLWQSEQYFKDIESVIRDDLRINPPSNAQNRRIADRILDCENTVAIHVRWFQSPETRNSTENASSAYYARSIEEIYRRLSSPTFVLFSDRPQAALSRLSLPVKQTVVVDHNDEHTAYADLWLMTLCRHFITANSTFSWWGAWLCENADKIICTPDPQLIKAQSWSFEGLIPDLWIRL